MTRLISKSRVLVPLLALTIIPGTALPASAVESTGAGHTYRGWECAYAQVWINNDAGSPFLQTMATMDRSVFAQGACEETTFVARAGTLAVRQDLLYWHWNEGRYVVCNNGPWSTNGWDTHDWWTWFSWQSNPCPAGNWFYGRGRSATWNGEWHGLDRAISTADDVWVG